MGKQIWSYTPRLVPSTLLPPELSFATETLLTHVGQTLPWPGLGYLRESSQDPGSEQSLSFLRNCLDDCLASHEACKSDSPFVPKRLVNIGASGETLNLVEPSGEGPMSYIAVSYCWGSGLPLRSLKTNYERLKQAIEWEELPLLIQDVAIIARKLGVRYLWIDALCIVQDDDNDWQQQYPFMSEIYEQAYLVIAAATSSKCDDSFIRSEENFRPPSLNFTFERSGCASTVRVREVESVGTHSDYETHFGGRDALEGRGWPLQERLLPTRLVVYSGSELQWLCKTKLACEAGHKASAAAQGGLVPLYSLKTSAEAYLWMHMQIKEYTKRHLTYPSDKLPAMAGVAKKISTITGSKYLAGIWKDNMIKDLCWERHRWQSLKWCATLTYRAPTFSWASVEGNCFYNNDSISGDGVYLTEAVTGHCTLTVPSSLFGQVSDGFVKVRGPLIEGKVIDYPWAGPGIMWTHEFRAGDWVFPFVSDTALAEVPANDGSVTATRVVDEQKKNIKGAVISALCIGSWVEYLSKSSGQTWVAFIFLGKSRRVPGAYERLGFVNTCWPPDGSRFPHTRHLKWGLWLFGGDHEKVEVTIV